MTIAPLHDAARLSGEPMSGIGNRLTYASVCDGIGAVRGQPKEIADTLTSCDRGTHSDSKPHVAGAFGVRRLTPRECERLQGFPDDYTLVPFRGKPAADAPRYKALGNSMAVPVMAWIGQRIAAVQRLENRMTEVP
jgi:DNA (cytosine-5)-methyltransferase 1